MCPDKCQELHEWIGVALIILLSIYSGTILKDPSWRNGENLCFKAANEIFNMFGKEKEETLQKVSWRLTSKPPSTSVQQLHWQVLICYPQQPESHQSHLQNRGQWYGQERFFAQDPTLKITNWVNISFCIVFRKRRLWCRYAGHGHVLLMND